MASKDFKVKNGLTVTGDATVAGYSYLTFVTSNTLTVANTIVGTISSLANHSTSNVTEGSRLYYTDARAYANTIILLQNTTVSGSVTGNVNSSTVASNTLTSNTANIVTANVSTINVTNNIVQTLQNTISVEMVIVAGGGGGGYGTGTFYGGGGGGAGGVYIGNVDFEANATPFTVTVGAGGTAGNATLSSNATIGGNSFVVIGSSNTKIAIGGGTGAPKSGRYVAWGGGDGGSAGGGAGTSYGGINSSSGVALQPGSPTGGYGNVGGVFYTGNGYGAAGGGAGTAGYAYNDATYPGQGGSGIYLANFTQWGTDSDNFTSNAATRGYFGGGGAGGHWYLRNPKRGGSGGGGTGGSNGTLAGSGIANTGGAGGGGDPGSATGDGGSGGSGIVILRYPSTYPNAITTGSVTSNISGGYKYYAFASSGTIAIPLVRGQAVFGTTTINGDLAVSGNITGNITGLTTANVTELTNLYFTNARSRLAISVSGAGSYDNTTGIVTINTSSSSYGDANTYANVRLIGYATNINVDTKANVVDLTTANVTELTNLYFTNARVYSNITSLGYITSSSLTGYATNTQLASYATNAQLSVYATNAQLASYATTTNVALKANVVDLTTANVTELTNLYFTNARSRQAISVSGAGSYNNTTGVITINSSSSTYGDANVYSNVGLIGYATNANAALKANVVDLTTANVTELTNLYFTNARVYSNVSTYSGNVSSLVITSNTTSTSIATGALIVTGGVGIAGAVNIGGIQPIASSAPPTVEYLVVAGGGGGGGSVASYSGGGGGGAGGYRTASGFAVASGTPITVTVGGGGSGGPGSAGDAGSRGTSGNASVFSTITSAAGGGGAGATSGAALTGGSGGGGGYTNTAGAAVSVASQGNAGGNGSTAADAGGGGGGAGAAGGNASGTYGVTPLGGTGGAGAESSISGASTYYAGGGGGGTYSAGGAGAGRAPGAGGAGGGGAGGPISTYTGIAGTTNTGGGGGGSTAAATVTTGGNGGSGIVIIRYLDTYALATTTGSPTVTTSGGYRTYIFTSSGTITFDGSSSGIGSTPSSNTTTGALVVTGGAGIAGNLYLGGNLVVSGNITGNITGLTTASVPELTNLYFTNARSRLAISVSGAGSYNNTTGVITINSSSSTYGDANTYANVRLIGYATNANVATKANVVDLTTANVTELTNLYFTNARVYSNVVSLGYLTSSSLSGYATNAQLASYATNAQLASYATNAQLSVYATNAQLTSYFTVANAALKANIVDLTTANVTELTNLYFTNARSRQAISVTGAGSYNNTTGVITINSSSSSYGDANVYSNVSTYSGNVTSLVITSNTNSTSNNTGALVVEGGAGFGGVVNIRGQVSTIGILSAPSAVEYLMVAGGGSGAYHSAGGGGAGGYLSNTNFAVTSGSNVIITVGAGGTVSTGANGNKGSNSSIIGNITVTAIGGGGGGSFNSIPTGGAGGSGGGGSDGSPGGAATAGQGNTGGAGYYGTLSYTSGGGGGGSAAVGNTGSSSTGGAGGAGTANTITGSVVYRAGGGGGSGLTTGGLGGTGGGGAGGNTSTSAVSGTVNTGGGGGGGKPAEQGGLGGSGVVIIRYADTYGIATTTGSPTYTVTGGYRIYQFNSSGSIIFAPSGLGATGPAPSTSTSTGALVVEGGAGIAGSLNLGGNLVVSGNITGNITGLTTASVPELTNLYFTNARAIASLTAGQSITIDANGRINSTATGGGGSSTYGDSNVALLGYATNANVATKANISDLTTANVTELTNLYFTNARAILNVIPAITELSVTTPGMYYNIDQYTGSNPSIDVRAGETISFSLSVPGHPFMIRVSSGGANYDTGLTHVATDGTVSTGSSAQGKVSGKLFWKIPYSLAGSTYVYQCSVHSGMVGSIVISKSVNSTTDLTEGSNLYFTNARSIAALTAGQSITIDANGRINSTATGGSSYSDSNVYSNVGLIGYATNANVATKANVVDLTTANVVELSNLYFTNARSRQAISVSGAGSYNNTTGVITINSSSSTYGDANARQAISVTGAGSYDNTTGVITINSSSSSYADANVYSNVRLIGYATNANVAAKANIADLTTANVTELTNLYFTNARSRQAISVTGYGSYDNATGVINITGDGGGGGGSSYTDSNARQAISVSGPGSYDNTTGIITINSSSSAYADANVYANVSVYSGNIGSITVGGNLTVTGKIILPNNFGFPNVTIGNTTPVTSVVGDYWFDSQQAILAIYTINDTDNSYFWLDVSGSTVRLADQVLPTPDPVSQFMIPGLFSPFVLLGTPQ